MSLVAFALFTTASVVYSEARGCPLLLAYWWQTNRSGLVGVPFKFLLNLYMKYPDLGVPKKLHFFPRLAEITRYLLSVPVKKSEFRSSFP